MTDEAEASLLMARDKERLQLLRVICLLVKDLGTKERIYGWDDMENGLAALVTQDDCGNVRVRMDS